jgi:hypothetical protein
MANQENPVFVVPTDNGTPFSDKIAPPPAPKANDFVGNQNLIAGKQVVAGNNWSVGKKK